MSPLQLHHAICCHRHNSPPPAASSMSCAPLHSPARRFAILHSHAHTPREIQSPSRKKIYIFDIAFFAPWVCRKTFSSSREQLIHVCQLLLCECGVRALPQRRQQGQHVDRDRAEAEHAQHAAKHREVKRELVLLPLCVGRDLCLQRLACCDSGVEALDECVLR